MYPVARAALLVGLAGGLLAGPSAAQDRAFTDRYCVAAPHGEVCATMPFDQTDFSSNFEYMIVVKGAQDPFDVFSWQSFVALNWPSGTNGAPMDVSIGEAPNAPRVWQSFDRPDNVFGTAQASVACENDETNSGLLIDELMQADGTVLVDQGRNFVVYDTRLNDVVFDYILDNGLETSSGQSAFGYERAISFPLGISRNTASGDAGSEPSVLVKTSWRILSKPAEESRFFTRDGVIHIPESRSLSEQETCLAVRLGLIGMHIVVRTESGNGNEWIWTTFEHVNNVPIAGNARRINSIYSSLLFPGGCAAPEVPPENAFSLFDPDCEDCANNVAPKGAWSWSATPPFARLSGVLVKRGTQVVRCWEIFESTAEVNRLWQEKLAGTIWSNYMLISTQWRGANKSPLFEHGEVPRFLSNTTMETYIQDKPNGTCLGCHAEATTAAGQPSNFTFLLRRAP